MFGVLLKKPHGKKKKKKRKKERKEKIKRLRNKYIKTGKAESAANKRK